MCCVFIQALVKLGGWQQASGQPRQTSQAVTGWARRILGSKLQPLRMVGALCAVINLPIKHPVLVCLDDVASREWAFSVQGLFELPCKDT